MQTPNQFERPEGIISGTDILSEKAAVFAVSDLAYPFEEDFYRRRSAGSDEEYILIQEKAESSYPVADIIGIHDDTGTDR